MIRIYPTRLTRNIWKIPLYSIHECSEQCDKDDTSDSNSKDDNTRCIKKNKLCKTEIHIASFNKSDPRGLHGKLYQSEEIFIPDKEIDMLISFPLNNFVNMHIVSNGKNFSLSDILYAIKISYIQIYSQEELTATPRVFILETKCGSCNKSLIKSSMKYVNRKDLNNDVCSICYDSLKGEDKDSVLKLDCGHVYHKSCIDRWIDCDKRTCPNCRDYILKCNTCSGKGLIEYEYHSVVLPYELRSDNFPFRNYTDGIYGIYLYDLEELFLNEMVYDRLKKKLYISVGI